MGFQVAQVKLFTHRFLTDFREMSMAKLVLPCNLDGTLPFVAQDGLPCPALSTMNALRWLEQTPGFLKEKRGGESHPADGEDLHHRRSSEVARV